MSKTIIGLILAVVIIGGGVMVFGNKNADKNSDDSGVIENSDQVMNNENENMENENMENSNGKKMAFDAFLKQGGSYECTVTQNLENVSSAGKVWFDGVSNTGSTSDNANMRMSGEFATTVAGQNFKSYMILSDGYTYTWSDSMPSIGMKIKNTSTTSTNTNQGTSANITWDSKNIGDYDCNAWTVVESKFALPKSVTFTELK